MTVKHDIDDEGKLITTTFSDDVIDNDLVEILNRYFRDIKSQPQYVHYNEIIDLRAAKRFKLDAHTIRELAKISSTYDNKEVRTKLVLLASSMLAFGFAKIYEVARKFGSKSSKEVRVFKTTEDALAWFNEDG